LYVEWMWLRAISRILWWLWTPVSNVSVMNWVKKAGMKIWEIKKKNVPENEVLLKEKTEI
jgi:hypothetical protein